MKPPQERLYFLDWVRIIAFLLLILYHVGMFYIREDWHVKSLHASGAIEPLMLLSSPWRLSLLFLVSGVASSCLLAKMGAARFMRQRSARLLVPLLFGMLVIVPPQPYFEVIEKVAYQGSYLDFMRLYLTGYGDFCRGTDCLDLPTWNHLWFVAYLWVYTLLLGALVLSLGARFDAIAKAVVAQLAGWRLIALPVAVLAVLRIGLATRFPTTHALVDDWYNHANYIAVFLLGAMMAREPGVWRHVESMRWPALGIALSCWAALNIYWSLPEALTMQPGLHPWRLVFRVVYTLCAWCAIVAACGFARRHLNRDSGARRYLTEAAFPVYILHQSLIVTMAHLIKPANIAPPVEGLILVLLTLTISLGAFAVIRRVALLRPLFGLAPLAGDTFPARQANEKPATARAIDGPAAGT